MKRLFPTLFSLMMALLTATAQELTVLSMTEVDNITDSNLQRFDINGELCALVRVTLSGNCTQFEGNTVGEIVIEGNRYMVYLSNGTRMLRILPTENFPLMVTFADYGIRQVKGGKVYDLFIDSNRSANTMTSSKSSISKDVKTFRVEDITFCMVSVEGGTFTMGATKEQQKDADKDETPAHEVTLSSYFIGETEVTQALWEAVMGKNMPKEKDANEPVEIDWEQCIEFITKLNAITGEHFRLPTEAEWEYAARGGNKSHGYKYSGSDNPNTVAWYSNNSNVNIQRVKQKKPNELGLYDMSGNVSEWCQDWKADYSRKPQTDPKGPIKGSYHIERGGSYLSDQSRCRVSYRLGGIGRLGCGLRLAM